MGCQQKNYRNALRQWICLEKTTDLIPVQHGQVILYETNCNVVKWNPDTDAAGVVYYANYLKFCERARTEWLRAAGFEQNRLLGESGIVFVVRAVKADYLQPALLDEMLQVVTTIDKLGHASMVFAQKINRGEDTLFDAQVVIACVDWNRRRSAAIPPAIRTQLERFISS
ncbi:MAG: tol-pal system-associated acyl-CoA thioesterase [Zoogloea sp.]|nr:tol-pal system-associated acyl-CoA thioesterase [Zoogloea sp.]